MHGFIKEIKIDVPWELSTSFLVKPVKLEINGIYLLTTNRHTTVTTLTEAEKEEQLKEQLVKKFTQEFLQKEIDALSSFGTDRSTSPSFFERTEPILRNLMLKVSSLHIRHEEERNPGVFFAFGITCDTFEITSDSKELSDETNDNADDAHAPINKSLHLTQFGVYLDATATNSAKKQFKQPSEAEKIDHDYILAPLNLSFYVSIFSSQANANDNNDSNTYLGANDENLKFYSFSFDLDNISTALKAEQCDCLVKMIKASSGAISRRTQRYTAKDDLVYPKTIHISRSTTSEHGRKKRTLKQVADQIVAANRAKRASWKWDTILQFINAKKDYIALYSEQIRSNKKLDKEKLKAYEKSFSVEQIVLFRYIALRNEKMSVKQKYLERAKEGSWFSFLPQAFGFGGAQDEEEEKTEQEFKAEYDKIVSELTKVPVKRVFNVSMNIEHFSVVLINERNEVLINPAGDVTASSHSQKRSDSFKKTSSLILLSASKGITDVTLTLPPTSSISEALSLLKFGTVDDLSISVRRLCLSHNGELKNGNDNSVQKIGTRQPPNLDVSETKQKRHYQSDDFEEGYPIIKAEPEEDNDKMLFVKYRRKRGIERRFEAFFSKAKLYITAIDQKNIVEQLYSFAHNLHMTANEKRHQRVLFEKKAASKTAYDTLVSYFHSIAGTRAPDQQSATSGEEPLSVSICCKAPIAFLSETRNGPGIILDAGVFDCSCSGENRNVPHNEIRFSYKDIQAFWVSKALRAKIPQSKTWDTDVLSAKSMPILSPISFSCTVERGTDTTELRSNTESSARWKVTCTLPKLSVMLSKEIVTAFYSLHNDIEEILNECRSSGDDSILILPRPATMQQQRKKREAEMTFAAPKPSLMKGKRRSKSFDGTHDEAFIAEVSLRLNEMSVRLSTDTKDTSGSVKGFNTHFALSVSDIAFDSKVGVQMTKTSFSVKQLQLHEFILVNDEGGYGHIMFSGSWRQETQGTNGASKKGHRTLLNRVSLEHLARKDELSRPSVKAQLEPNNFLSISVVSVAQPKKIEVGAQVSTVELEFRPTAAGELYHIFDCFFQKSEQQAKTNSPMYETVNTAPIPDEFKLFFLLKKVQTSFYTGKKKLFSVVAQDCCCAGHNISDDAFAEGSIKMFELVSEYETRQKMIWFAEESGMKFSLLYKGATGRKGVLRAADAIPIRIISPQFDISPEQYNCSLAKESARLKDAFPSQLTSVLNSKKFRHSDNLQGQSGHTSALESTHERIYDNVFGLKVGITLSTVKVVYLQRFYMALLQYLDEWNMISELKRETVKAGSSSILPCNSSSKSITMLKRKIRYEICLKTIVLDLPRNSQELDEFFRFTVDELKVKTVPTFFFDTAQSKCTESSVPLTTENVQQTYCVSLNAITGVHSKDIATDIIRTKLSASISMPYDTISLSENTVAERCFLDEQAQNLLVTKIASIYALCGNCPTSAEVTKLLYCAKRKNTLLIESQACQIVSGNLSTDGRFEVPPVSVTLTKGAYRMLIAVFLENFSEQIILEEDVPAFASDCNETLKAAHLQKRAADGEEQHKIDIGMMPFSRYSFVLPKVSFKLCTGLGVDEKNCFCTAECTDFAINMFQHGPLHLFEVGIGDFSVCDNSMATTDETRFFVASHETMLFQRLQRGTIKSTENKQQKGSGNGISQGFYFCFEKDNRYSLESGQTSIATGILNDIYCIFSPTFTTALAAFFSYEKNTFEMTHETVVWKQRFMRLLRSDTTITEKERDEFVAPAFTFIAKGLIQNVHLIFQHERRPFSKADLKRLALDLEKIKGFVRLMYSLESIKITDTQSCATIVSHETLSTASRFLENSNVLNDQRRNRENRYDGNDATNDVTDSNEHIYSTKKSSDDECNLPAAVHSTTMTSKYLTDEQNSTEQDSLRYLTNFTDAILYGCVDFSTNAIQCVADIGTFDFNFYPSFVSKCAAFAEWAINSIKTKATSSISSTNKKQAEQQAVVPIIINASVNSPQIIIAHPAIQGRALFVRLGRIEIGGDIGDIHARITDAGASSTMGIGSAVHNIVESFSFDAFVRTVYPKLGKGGAAERIPNRNLPYVTVQISLPKVTATLDEDELGFVASIPAFLQRPDGTFVCFVPKSASAAMDMAQSEQGTESEALQHEIEQTRQAVAKKIESYAPANFKTLQETDNLIGEIKLDLGVIGFEVEEIAKICMSGVRAEYQMYDGTDTLVNEGWSAALTVRSAFLTRATGKKFSEEDDCPSNRAGVLAFIAPNDDKECGVVLEARALYLCSKIIPVAMQMVLDVGNCSVNFAPEDYSKIVFCAMLASHEVAMLKGSRDLLKDQYSLSAKRRMHQSVMYPKAPAQKAYTFNDTVPIDSLIDISSIKFCLVGKTTRGDITAELSQVNINTRESFRTERERILTASLNNLAVWVNSYQKDAADVRSVKVLTTTALMHSNSDNKTLAIKLQTANVNLSVSLNTAYLTVKLVEELCAKFQSFSLDQKHAVERYDRELEQLQAAKHFIAVPEHREKRNELTSFSQELFQSGDEEITEQELKQQTEGHRRAEAEPDALSLQAQLYAFLKRQLLFEITFSSIRITFSDDCNGYDKYLLKAKSETLSLSSTFFSSHEDDFDLGFMCKCTVKSRNAIKEVWEPFVDRIHFTLQCARRNPQKYISLQINTDVLETTITEEFAKSCMSSFSNAVKLFSGEHVDSTWNTINVRVVNFTGVAVRVACELPDPAEELVKSFQQGTVSPAGVQKRADEQNESKNDDSLWFYRVDQAATASHQYSTPSFEESKFTVLTMPAHGWCGWMSPDSYSALNCFVKVDGMNASERITLHHNQTQAVLLRDGAGNRAALIVETASYNGIETIALHSTVVFQSLIDTELCIAQSVVPIPAGGRFYLPLRTDDSVKISLREANGNMSGVIKLADLKEATEFQFITLWPHSTRISRIISPIIVTRQVEIMSADGDEDGAETAIDDNGVRLATEYTFVLSPPLTIFNGLPYPCTYELLDFSTGSVEAFAIAPCDEYHCATFTSGRIYGLRIANFLGAEQPADAEWNVINIPFGDKVDDIVEKFTQIGIYPKDSTVSHRLSAHDNRGNMSMFRLAYTVADNAPLRISVVSQYYLRNCTLMPLELSSNNQFIVSSDCDAVVGLPFLAENTDEIRFKIGNSRWSTCLTKENVQSASVVILSPPQDVKDAIGIGERSYNFVAEIEEERDPRFHGSRLIVLKPMFTIHNTCPFPILLCYGSNSSNGANHTPDELIFPNGMLPLYNMKGLLLRATIEGFSWSHQIDLTKIETNVVELSKTSNGKRTCYYITTEFVAKNGEVTVTFAPGNPPFILENYTQFPIEFCQGNSGSGHRVSPRHRLSYCWDMLYASKELFVVNTKINSPGTGVVITLPSEEGSGKRECFVKTYVTESQQIIKFFDIGMREALLETHEALRFKLIATFGGLGVSFVDKKPEELLYAKLVNAQLSYLELEASDTFVFSVEDIIVDNQTPKAQYYNIFRKHLVTKFKTQAATLVELVLFRDLTQTRAVITPFHDVTLSISDMDLSIDQSGYDALNYVYRAAAALFSGRELGNGAARPAITILQQSNPFAMKHYSASPAILIERLCINPGIVSFSASAPPDGDESDPVFKWFCYTGNVTHSPIRLGSLVWANRFMPAALLANDVVNFYKGESVPMIISVVFHTRLLAPVTFFTNIAAGLRDMAACPVNGALSSEGFLAGLKNGGESFADHTGYAVSNTLASVAGAVNMVTEKVSGGPSLPAHQPATGIKSGIVYGTKYAARSLVDGAKSLVVEPEKAVKEKGAAGVFVGVAKGVACTAIAPFKAVSGFAYEVASGFRNQTQKGAVEIYDQRQRPQRIPVNGVVHMFSLFDTFMYTLLSRSKVVICGDAVGFVVLSFSAGANQCELPGAGLPSVIPCKHRKKDFAFDLSFFDAHDAKVIMLTTTSLYTFRVSSGAVCSMFTSSLTSTDITCAESAAGSSGCVTFSRRMDGLKDCIMGTEQTIATLCSFFTDNHITVCGAHDQIRVVRPPLSFA